MLVCKHVPNLVSYSMKTKKVFVTLMLIWISVSTVIDVKRYVLF